MDGQSMSLYHIPQNLISISRRFCFCVWWTSTGIIYYELRYYDQMITADIYFNTHTQLQQEFKNSENNPLLSIIAKALCSFKSRVYESETNWTFNWEILLHLLRLLHPPFPDISPFYFRTTILSYPTYDYHLFLPMIIIFSLNHVRDRKFKNREKLEKELNNFFASKDRHFFRSGINLFLADWKLFQRNKFF